MPSVNPYQAASPVIDDRQNLAFDSVIESSDYAALLPHRDLEAILIKILFGLLVFMSVVFAAMIIMALVLRGWHESLIPVAILTVVMMTGTAYLVRYTRAGQRSRGKLKHNPDLLSVARGELTELGIAFYDGTRQHWFGPQYLVNTVVSDVGVRVYVDQNPYRYLALTSRMFDSYSVKVAERLRQHWCDQAAHATDPGVPAGLDAWTALNPMPEDAIAFVGTVTMTQPMRTPEVRKIAIIESISILGMILIGVICNGADLFWFGYAAIAYALFALYFNAKRWWQYFHGTSVNAWNQRGWISLSELAILMGSRGVRMPLREVGNYVDHGSTLEIATSEGGTFFIARDHVASDADWTQMVHGCRAIVKHEQLSR
ncbi:hypothetical protein [Neorhodopirellula lusitana]|uniref:hypothetical protein n=1 Tax=Neorhodopirellula lusitana TaxID=445327 RepID=UPI00384D1291